MYVCVHKHVYVHKHINFIHDYIFRTYIYTFLCVYVYLRAKPFCLTSSEIHHQILRKVLLIEW